VRGALLGSAGRVIVPILWRPNTCHGFYPRCDGCDCYCDVCGRSPRCTADNHHHRPSDRKRGGAELGGKGSSPPQRRQKQRCTRQQCDAMRCDYRPVSGTVLDPPMITSAHVSGIVLVSNLPPGLFSSRSVVGRRSVVILPQLPGGPSIPRKSLTAPRVDMYQAPPSERFRTRRSAGGGRAP
jgi:hypothetical protein